jgi:signal transduction histidine kinase
MGILGIIQLGGLLLGGGGPVAAFDAPPRVPARIEEAAQPHDAGMVLTTWSQRDGLPAGPDYLVCTRSGILLFAGQGRIHRFDGSRFSVVEDDDGSPFALDAIMEAGPGAADEVWFGTRNGQAVRIGPRGVQRYGKEEGLTENTDIRRVQVVGDDTVAATSVGLYRLRQDRWEPVPLEGIAGHPVFALEFDGQRFWAIVDSQLVAIARDLGSYEVVKDLSGDAYSGLAGDARRGVWFWQASGERNLCRLDADAACYRIDGVFGPAIGLDGVLHWVDGTRVMRFDAHARRLTAVDTGLHLEEIRDGPGGVLWLVAGGRLARLARTPVEAIPVPGGGVVPAGDGDVWVGSFDEGMLRVGRAPPGAPLYVNNDGHVRVGPWPAGTGRVSRRLSAAAAAAESRPVVLEQHNGMPQSIVQVDALDGERVMAATLESPALWIGDRAGWHPHPSPPLDKGSVVRGIAHDATGGILVGAMRDHAGLYRFDGAQWHALPARGEGRDDVVAMHLDDRGRLWLGSRGAVVLVAGGRTTVFGREQGLAIGAVRSIRQVAGEIWASGQKGMARFRGDGFDTLSFDARTPVTGITGFAFDDDGTMWLGAAEGIVRVSKAQWSSAVGRPGVQARVTLLGEAWGVAHPIVQTAPLPTVARTSDGRIWFYTLGMMYRIDPRRMPPPRSAPPLAISSVVVDGKRHLPGKAIEFPAGAHRLVFAFHALAPVVPERTAFRYRIVGLDEDWTRIDADEVVLDRLPPGRYTLQLQSSAEDGAWTGTPAVQAFTIPPTFMQSIWSKLLLVVLVVAATAVAFILRARQIESRRRVIVEAKLREREKIARDMHDTLLQGVNGLLLAMQATVTRMDGQPVERSRLEDSIGIAERILEEGRDRVSGLRSNGSPTLGLVKALQVHARDLAHERRVMCEVQVLGEPELLVPAVEDEMVQIGREALTNAFFHACATSITLSIVYGEAGVNVQVCDDGIGLQAPATDREHWGIRGMEERAAAIGGHLAITPRAGGGTCVSLEVPAPVARGYGLRRSSGVWKQLVERLRRRRAGSPRPGSDSAAT